MAKYHDIDSEIWEGLLDYSPNQKLLYIYLFSNPLCRPSGLYTINIKTIEHHTGTSENEFKSIIGKLIEYDFDTKEIWVRGKMKRILSGFMTNSKMRQSVEGDYKGLVSPLIKEAFYKKYEGALKGLVSPPLPLTLTLPLKEERGLGKTEEAGTGTMGEPDSGTKLSFGENKLVKLTADEHSKLTARFGQAQTEAYILKLENYIGSKGKKYKSHYFTILSWVDKDGGVKAADKPPLKIAGRDYSRDNEEQVLGSPAWKARQAELEKWSKRAEKNGVAHA